MDHYQKDYNHNHGEAPQKAPKTNSPNNTIDIIVAVITTLGILIISAVCMYFKHC